MEKITNFYQNNGYFNFRILDTDIQTNEDKTKQTIKVTVSEGDRFQGNVRIEGDTLEVPKEDLEKLLTMKRANGMSARKCPTARSHPKPHGSGGYAFSEINVQPIPNAEHIPLILC